MFDEDEFTENEIWFNNHRDFFPANFRENLESIMDMCTFHRRVFNKVMDELRPKVRQLMMKQFPLLRTETRPLVVKSIDDIVHRTGQSMLFNLYGLMQDQRNGVDLREKYPDFDSWIRLYVHPPKPKLTDISFYNIFPEMTYEQKKELVDEEYEQDVEAYNWNESRRFEFFDLIQKVVFKHYGALQDLEGDGWNVYAIHVGMEYHLYRDDCYHIENFIEAKFPEEDINLSYPEYVKKLTQLKLDEIAND
jgi:hypothetical protein